MDDGCCDAEGGSNGGADDVVDDDDDDHVRHTINFCDAYTKRVPPHAPTCQTDRSPRTPDGNGGTLITTGCVPGKQRLLASVLVATIWILVVDTDWFVFG